MRRRDKPRSGSGFWRLTALTTAAGLGVAAVWLVVFSNSAKQTQIGVLLGAWAVFVAGPVVFNNRRAQQAAQLRESRAQAEELYELQLEVSRVQQEQLELAKASQQSQELELRRLGEMQLSRETAVRREADFRLEIGLRGEVERVVAQHIAELRDEIAALRAEVVDKVNGQLWLERVETTRVIASDLEALQSELRRIAAQDRVGPSGAGPAIIGELQQGGNANGSATHGWTAPAAARVAADVTDQQAADDVVEAEIVEPAAAPANPPVGPPSPAELVVDASGPEAPSPARAEEQQPAPTSTGSTLGADPFAGLPRLSPLPDDVAGILEPDGESGADGPRGAFADVPIDDARYVGRRRAAGEQPLAAPEPSGRRRAPADAADDLLARMRGL